MNENLSLLKIGAKNGLRRASLYFALIVFGLFCASSNAQDGAAGYVGPEYQIGPEDVLEISVWREPDLQRTVLVRPDGGISFPLAGSLPAAGLTTSELEGIITAKLQRFIPEAVVTVSVNTVSGYRIYVIGQVDNPGQYVVGRYVDVVQALTLAGGLTPFADDDNISVLRRRGNEVDFIPFRFDQVEKGIALEQNIMLLSEDVVLVP